MRRQSREEEPSLAEMITECANCEVHQDDPLPKQICLTCVIDTKNAFRFKKKCEQSYKSLLESLGEDNAQLSITSIDMDCVKIEKTEIPEESGEHKGMPNKSLSSILSINAPVESMVCDNDILVNGFLVRGLPSNNPHNSGQLKCPHCPKYLSNSLSLQGHIRLHGRNPYKCLDCFEAFAERPQLEEHTLRCHSVERPFRCSECLKSFSTNTNLQLHLRVHSVKRSFACPHCPRAFQLLSHLEKHIRIHDPLKCPHCPMTFLRKKDLNYHNLDHTGERPYKYPKCSKAFKKKQHLEYHMFTHMGQSL